MSRRAASGAMTWAAWAGAIVRKGARKGRVERDLSGGRLRVHWEDDTHTTERRRDVVMVSPALMPPLASDTHPLTWSQATWIILGILTALVIVSGVMIVYGSPR